MATKTTGIRMFRKLTDVRRVAFLRMVAFLLTPSITTIQAQDEIKSRDPLTFGLSSQGAAAIVKHIRNHGPVVTARWMEKLFTAEVTRQEKYGLRNRRRQRDKAVVELLNQNTPATTTITNPNAFTPNYL